MAWELKAGVSLVGLNIVMRKALLLCHDEYKKINVTMRITCTTGGLHSLGSLHYYGYAVDLGINNIPTIDAKNKLLLSINSRFTDTGFQIISEDDHFHIEYDKITRA